MNKALVFLAYHPGSLVEYECIKNIDKEKSLYILIICEHPYVNQEIIELYSKKFKHVLCLPDIDYKTNIFKGLTRYSKFLRIFHKKIDPILEGIESFNLISDCSAYLPVNALLTELRKRRKCKNLISIREDYGFGIKINIFETVRAMFYTFLLGIYPVYAHKMLSYMYIKEPRDKIIKLISPFEKNIIEMKGNKKGFPIYLVFRPLPRGADAERDIVIVYSDTQVGYKCDEEKLKMFFISLSRYYKNCKIVCKPHPQCRGKVMSGMENIEYELYNRGLTSQLHLGMNIQKVKACYSVSSTSLLYSAALGIPSYTIYKYLEFNGKYPKEFFENYEVSRNPFLYNVKSLDEIGIIDSIKVEPETREFEVNWDELMG